MHWAYAMCGAIVLGFGVVVVNMRCKAPAVLEFVLWRRDRKDRKVEKLVNKVSTGSVWGTEEIQQGDVKNYGHADDRKVVRHRHCWGWEMTWEEASQGQSKYPLCSRNKGTSVTKGVHVREGMWDGRRQSPGHVQGSSTPYALIDFDEKTEVTMKFEAGCDRKKNIPSSHPKKKDHL